MVRAPARIRAAGYGRGPTALLLITSTLCTCLILWWSYEVKMRCGGAPFTDGGRSLNMPGGDQDRLLPCYSDILQLWLGRGIDEHIFPYIHGGITADGTLFGGVVEYPVLSGLFMYLGAIGAHDDTEFFTHTALLLTPFALVITVLLALLARWRVLLWAATPPLLLYAFHNWELPVTATTVAAIAVMAAGARINPRTARRYLSLPTTAAIAAALLGVGFCLKLYPGIFVLPLALYVLHGGPGGYLRPSDGRRRLDWPGAGLVVGAATATVALIQLPFMVAGFEGWRAALTFQSDRKADATTNSIWYWGVRYLTDDQSTYDTVVGVVSPILVLCAFAVAIALGRRRAEQLGSYPWIGVAASMLAGFMLFHKVHSPQYTLWILPFFVLLRIPWSLIAAYLIADVVLDASVFRFLGFIDSGWPDGRAAVLVGVSSWIVAIVHLLLIPVFVAAPLAQPLRDIVSRGNSIDPGDGNGNDQDAPTPDRQTSTEGVG
ncbi:hypothetical protein QSJ18_01000 [Gordonia sp. ABSL1-1]|uniref:hypothetical protein n=1 Tax=Gordonia sp. ABSL1-1 TaxID=3053923 RepID=UPI002573F1FC|nr:hypothetical protein [Gordonia sp. ABSL1-1]MDL9935313.1 hypothetical protein [Gordonia sp. ABSL1-1]